MRRFYFLVAALVLGLAPTAAPAQVYGDPNSLVDFWYRTYFNRAPDPNYGGWAGELVKGNPPDTVLARMLGSEEFYAKAGGTPQGFITLLYGDISRRAPTPGELNYWVGRMYTSDRIAVADAILTQNPGVWIGTAAAAPPTLVTPPTVVAPPPVLVTPGVNWERDRHRDWDRYHDIHEYHRPDYHVHREEHHR